MYNRNSEKIHLVDKNFQKIPLFLYSIFSYYLLCYGKKSSFTTNDRSPNKNRLLGLPGQSNKHSSVIPNLFGNLYAIDAEANSA